MAVEENITIMRRWFKEVWNEGRLETVTDLLARDAVGIGVLEGGVPVRGPADFVPFVQRIRAAFPDINIAIDDIFGADDKVVTRWTSTMHHTGDYAGMPASNKMAKISGITIVRIENGQIAQGWDSWDQLGLQSQLSAAEAKPPSLEGRSAK